MTFVLFFYLTTFSATGGMTVTTADFSSKEQCEKAGEKVAEEFNSIMTQKPKWICVEK